MFRCHRLLVGAVVAVVAVLTLPLAVLAPASAHDVWTTELSGVMRDPGGAQAPGQVTAYRVNASGEVLETVSDDFLGPWSLSVPAGTYRISFSPGTSGLAGGWWQGKRTFETATQVTVTRGQQVSGLSHTFTGTGSISG